MTPLTTTLITGSNAPLSQDHTVEITIKWTSAPAELDVSCFMVNTGGKVPSDDYFIFYNQSSDPGQIVRFQPVDARSVAFTIQLNSLYASDLDKCVFAATLDGPGTFAEVQGCTITAKSAGGEIVYAIIEGKEETSMVLAELYRHQSWLKLRAVGRGFNGGLKPLAESHGVTVEESASAEPGLQEASHPKAEQLSAPIQNAVPVASAAVVAPTPGPASAPAPEKSTINLNKIDLLKKKVRISLEKKKIDTIKARVAVVFDASGSMSMLYAKGTVQRAFERVLAVAACMDDDGEMDVWFFGSKSKRMPSVREHEYENYVKRVYPKPKIFGGLGAGNNEPDVMKDIIKKYTVEQPNNQIPTYIIFFSDGGIYETPKISQLLVDSSKSSIFWQFVGLGDADFGVLEELDDLQGRYIDNADFFALDDLDEVSDEDLYDRLFNEFPGWLRQAKDKGILTH
ncbi:vWA domain-containing protein [Paenibacillus nasutitermitis]|uniref:Tellurium resistance protein TerF n=1 Tax=Paenibacillus nasutitermitis TaxID=1652958 RepID=A0A916YV79_9BACL|nr:VWA domain-containing protein [Paenibacillus nasutitermitis]GGD63292.1 tellurium resistance protein TerF [Paenibacillus nasutitermitis]